MKELDYIHIHKGNEITDSTITFCKLSLHDAKRGAVRFANRHFADCPDCLKVAIKTEQLLGV
jgi:hypothetical protein